MTTHRLGARAGHRAPGWYPDPALAGRMSAEPRFRWWDGSAWTGWQSGSAHAPMPRGEAPRLPADDHLHWTGRHTIFLLAGVLVLALVVMTAVGMRAVRDRPGPGIAAPTGHADAPVAFTVNEEGDALTILGKVLVTLPTGSDWETSQQQTLAGTFTRYQLGGVAVGDQVAIWAAAVLSPALAGQDPEQTAHRAVAQWRTRATGTYALTSTTEPRLAPDPARPGCWIATFDSSSDDGESHHRMLLIPVPPGTPNNPHPYAVVLTMVPEQAPAAARTELDRVFDSVRVGN